MRTYPYQLRITAEDRKAVARWRRNIYMGYAVAALLVLASIAFAADQDDRGGQSAQRPVQVDHFGLDELVNVIVPQPESVTAGQSAGPSRDQPSERADRAPQPRQAEPDPARQR